MAFEDRVIVFYDGDCGFCNWIVAFILKAERGERIHFASLQSSFARDFFVALNTTPDLNTFYFYNGRKLYLRSEGALRLLSHLKWRFRLLKVFWLIPVALRDKLYDFVANRRKRIMKDKCVLPSPEQRRRFLDN